MKKVLGLDIGTNSLGFSYKKIWEEKGKLLFENIVENSIVFDNINTGFSAKERTDFRSGRKLNERSSRMMERIRKYFCHLGYAEESYIYSPTKYIENLNLRDQSVYEIRTMAVKNNKYLSKDEFIYTLYSIINHRGYSNQFSTGEEKDEKGLNEAISKNKKIFEDKKLNLPSEVLFMKKRELEDDGFINIAIRNKGGDYNNSLNRDMWKIELELIIDSQKDNKELFESHESFVEFKKILLEKSSEDEKENIGAFEQRPLKSTERLINYCSFYNQYHREKQLRCMPKANIVNIELTIRQVLENAKDNIVFENTGEIYKLSLDEIQEVVDFWIDTPNAQVINYKNILNVLNKKIKIIKKEKQEDLILDVKIHKSLIELFTKYGFDYKYKNNSLYSEILKNIHVWANEYQRKKEIKKADKKNILSDDFIGEIVSLDKGAKSKYSRYSLEFGQEVLLKMKVGKPHHEALEDLGMKDRFLEMKPCNYLPSLNPTKKDIEWLKKNIENFNSEDLFINPAINPAVKRVISILRRLVNDIIGKHGKPDRIVIETAKELNNEKVSKEYKTINSDNKKSKDAAVKKLEELNYKISGKNIDRLRLLKEQNCICLYSGKHLSEDDALDEEITEIEHFIPQSHFFDDSYKNKILVLKEYNQNKSSSHPVSFLEQKGLWNGFKENAEKTSLKSNKKKWLTDEDSINKVYDNPDLITRYLNDTRSATRTIKNYLEHYLYPKSNRYGKGESNSEVITVTGKAIHQLKYIWGVSAVEPKDMDNKKNRMTNYHHTLDALVISMVNTSTRNILHNYFKQKEETKHKNKALYEKLKSNYPVCTDGYSIASYAEELVRKYKNNEKYVCPMYKNKDNTQGFKLGNINLKILNVDGKEVLVEFEKMQINSDIFYKKDKMRNPTTSVLKEEEVKKEFDLIKDRLCKQRQAAIIKALEEYEKKYSVCAEIIKINMEIKKEKAKLPKNQKDDSIIINELKEKILLLENEKKEPFYFLTKKGKKQIVRSLDLPKKTKNGDYQKTSADTIYITDKRYKGERLKRLDIEVFKQLKKEKIPFVIKANCSDSVDYYNLISTSKGQVLGVNYFSGKKNSIKPKINPSKLKSIKNDDILNSLKVKKNNLILVGNEVFRVVGGNFTDNNFEVKQINVKENRRNFVAINKKPVASVVTIDFYGNIVNN